jgi:hypothetical protein
MGHRARFLALAGVCTFLTSLALAACGSATSARPVSPGFTGYDWQVTAISHHGKVTSIPARMQVALQFSPGGQFGANDSINFHSGTYRTTSDGFMTSALASTLVGYAGHDPAVLLAIGAIGSFGYGVHATVKADRRPARGQRRLLHTDLSAPRLPGRRPRSAGAGDRLLPDGVGDAGPAALGAGASGPGPAVGDGGG